MRLTSCIIWRLCLLDLSIHNHMWVVIVTHVAGRLCEIDIDDCVGDPCQHDGTCDDQKNGFTCRCLPGYAGKLCSETISHANNITKTSTVIYATNSSTNSTFILYEPLQDQPSGQVRMYAGIVYHVCFWGGWGWFIRGPNTHCNRHRNDYVNQF